MITEILIQLAGGFVCGGLGWLAKSLATKRRLATLQTDSWRAARIYYTRLAADVADTKKR